MALTLIAHLHEHLVDSMMRGWKVGEHPVCDSFAAQTDFHSVEQLAMARVAARCRSDRHSNDLRMRDSKSSLSKVLARQI